MPQVDQVVGVVLLLKTDGSRIVLTSISIYILLNAHETFAGPDILLPSLLRVSTDMWFLIGNYCSTLMTLQ